MFMCMQSTTTIKRYTGSFLSPSGNNAVLEYCTVPHCSHVIGTVAQLLVLVISGCFQSCCSGCPGVTSLKFITDRFVGTCGCAATSSGEMRSC